MNLLVVVGLAIASLSVIWTAQTVLLYCDGAKEVWRGIFRVKDASPFVRRSLAVCVQVVLVSFVIGYPLVIGQDPLDYHKQKLFPPHPEQLVEMLLVTVGCFAVGIGAEMLAGWVSVSPRHDWRTSLRKVIESILRPLPLAFLEEGIFRGILLEQTMVVLGTGRSKTIAAIGCSAAVFSALHFVRPTAKRWPVGGLFVLGVLLGTAYLVGGHSYWLPVGIHAGGVLVIKLLQPFIHFTGPTWVIGTRTYPIAGLVGMSAMLFLGAYVVLRFG
jgi:CAAX prenyl protease-like protein